MILLRFVFYFFNIEVIRRCIHARSVRIIHYEYTSLSKLSSLFALRKSERERCQANKTGRGGASTGIHSTAGSDYFLMARPNRGNGALEDF